MWFEYGAQITGVGDIPVDTVDPLVDPIQEELGRRLK
jgi:hypothetical protein